MSKPVPIDRTKYPSVSFRLRLTPQERKALEFQGRRYHFAAPSLAGMLFHHALEAYVRLEPHVEFGGFVEMLRSLGDETERKSATKTRKDMEKVIDALTWTRRYVGELQSSYRHELAARVTPRKVAR